MAGDQLGDFLGVSRARTTPHNQDTHPAYIDSMPYEPRIGRNFEMHIL